MSHPQLSLKNAKFLRKQTPGQKSEPISLPFEARRPPIRKYPDHVIAKSSTDDQKSLVLIQLPFDFCKYTIPREGTIAGRLHGLKKTGVCLQNEVALCRIFDVQNPFWNGNFIIIQNVANFSSDLVTTVEPII